MPKKTTSSSKKGASSSKKSGARSFVAPAQQQTSVPVDQQLNSGNSGLIIQRTGQLRNAFRSEGRDFAREMAGHVNEAQVGVATVYLYEETFGTQDRIHWLIHMKSLGDYQKLIEMGDTDEEFRSIAFKDRIPSIKGGGDWSRMFVDGSIQETVLIPQHQRIYGTRSDLRAEKSKARDTGAKSFVAPAQQQTSVPVDQQLNSGNSGLIIQRTGQLRNAFRSEGRDFAREMAAHVNQAQVGVATVYLYEETFGTQDRIHWLIHMKSLGDYQKLIEMGDTDEEFRSIAFRDRIPSTKGGGDWSRMFVDGSIQETVLIPQHQRIYGTK